MSLREPQTQEELLSNIQYSVIATRAALKLLIGQISARNADVAAALNADLGVVIDTMKNDASFPPEALDLAVELLENLRAATDVRGTSAP